MEDGSSEEYSFEYSDASQDEELVDADVENQYYAAKDALDTGDLTGASAGFTAILGLEAEKGEWGFKALKQLVKLHARQEQYGDMMARYRDLLGYTEAAVTKTVGEKGVVSVLDELGGQLHGASPGHLEQIYETTLECLPGQTNERLWATTSLKLGHLHLETRNYDRLAKLLRELTRYCMLPSNGSMGGGGGGGGFLDAAATAGIPGGSGAAAGGGMGGDHPLLLDDDVPFECFDPRKGAQLLEVQALTIQLHTAVKDNRKLRRIYERSLQIRSVIPHPRIMGVIRECGGKMHLAERDWDKARADFFEAFRNYDEAGAPRRLHCLKCVVLCNMLMESQINVFDSHEAKAYEQDPEIVAMVALVAAYESGSLRDFERILASRRPLLLAPGKRNPSSGGGGSGDRDSSSISSSRSSSSSSSIAAGGGGDDVVTALVGDLLRMMRTSVLLKMIQPYSRLALPFISSELGVPEDEVERLVAALILDERICGRIDQVSLGCGRRMVTAENLIEHTVLEGELLEQELGLHAFACLGACELVLTGTSPKGRALLSVDPSLPRSLAPSLPRSCLRVQVHRILVLDRHTRRRGPAAGNNASLHQRPHQQPHQRERQYLAMDRWCDQLERLHRSLLEQVGSL